jgi:hypothetical protein
MHLENATVSDKRYMRRAIVKQNLMAGCLGERLYKALCSSFWTLSYLRLTISKGETTHLQPQRSEFIPQRTSCCLLRKYTYRSLCEASVVIQPGRKHLGGAPSTVRGPHFGRWNQPPPRRPYVSPVGVVRRGTRSLFSSSPVLPLCLGRV